MMAAAKYDPNGVASAAQAALRDLVRLSHWGDSSFLNLPLIYPDGSHVTVKLDAVRDGIRVSDGGFAYRLLEHIGAQRSFRRTAKTLASDDELCVDAHSVFADVMADELVRTICDVAMASWLVTDKVYQRAADEDATALEEHLRDRLEAIFPGRLVQDRTVRGASTAEWDFSAVVRSEDGVPVLFQAVSQHPHSVNRASTSFMDMNGLERPPHLVAVVQSKAALGPKLALLSQAGGRVIEEGQSDEVYRRAAA